MHSDLKPENVMIFHNKHAPNKTHSKHSKDEGVLKLIDFGGSFWEESHRNGGEQISQKIACDSLRPSHQQDVVYTARYASPEQLIYCFSSEPIPVGKKFSLNGIGQYSIVIHTRHKILWHKIKRKS